MMLARKCIVFVLHYSLEEKDSRAFNPVDRWLWVLVDESQGFFFFFVLVVICCCCCFVFCFSRQGFSV
jgi:hypothetical protein